MHNTLHKTVSRLVEGHETNILKAERARARIGDGKGGHSRHSISSFQVFYRFNNWFLDVVWSHPQAHLAPLPRLHHQRVDPICHTTVHSAEKVQLKPAGDVKRSSVDETTMHAAAALMLSHARRMFGSERKALPNALLSLQPVPAVVRSLVGRQTFINPFFAQCWLPLPPEVYSRRSIGYRGNLYIIKMLEGPQNW
jgi:hypothetical protein